MEIAARVLYGCHSQYEREKSEGAPTKKEDGLVGWLVEGGLGN